jgi:hypothetical protein
VTYKPVLVKGKKYLDGLSKGGLAWREAYRDLFPQVFLDSFPMTFKIYCWILEKNPAIKIYEFSGAIFKAIVRLKPI